MGKLGNAPFSLHRERRLAVQGRVTMPACCRHSPPCVFWIRALTLRRVLSRRSRTTVQAALARSGQHFPRRNTLQCADVASGTDAD